MRLLISFLILSFVTYCLYPQRTSPDKMFTVAFYNVENLYDTENDPETEDDEFTPESNKKWDNDKYKKKLKDLSKVFHSLNSVELPEIIGLCEVENKQVLKDLTTTGKLARGNYGIVHENSPDIRGIDVALLYRKEEFQYLSHRSIPVHFRFDTAARVRSILYVKGKTGKNEIFHFFVNHWKSRSGGQQATEPKRIFTAVTLRKVVDSIFNIEPDAKIIIMGDFNDEPTNISIHSILQANNKEKNANLRELYNLMYNMHNIGNRGTYSYKGDWIMLDQIIVSQKVINDKKGYHCDFSSAVIYQDDWMMYDNPKVGMLTPNRTYGGDMYFGGVSDHLPVFVVLRKE
ncbi:MAG: hypothetical protein IIB05_08800 [Bacteroidetes bacterium]|nr:hypothetical protein [Bacteroidota bacterium]